ncbi:MAG: LuxR C-terminal-related transcriptional regulator [Chloroflexi bacterium]|nr:LuxR C-terminal-related transcriptional regulator [Chloroflexota bacterium]
MGLARADIQAVLGFLAELDELDDQEPYGVEMLRRLRQLIPSAVVSYQEADLRARGYTYVISDDLAGDDAGDDDLYWRVGPCPIADYRARTGDLSTIRMSDVIARSRFHEQPVYREYFAPGAIEYALDLGLGANRDGYRSVVLLRERDDPDFTERDRAVLELLRPHLRAREARAELATLASGTAHDVDHTEPPDHVRLTTREREIVALVGAGKTNAQIAAELWVTPGTVKKHLENVYVKLGVGSRAAAASRAQAGGVAT